MKLVTTIRLAEFCQKFVFTSAIVGPLLWLLFKAFKIEEKDVYSMPILGICLIFLQFAFFLCFFGMLIFMYKIEPKIQLRGKKISELEKVLLNADLEPWHTHAAKLIEN